MLLSHGLVQRGYAQVTDAPEAPASAKLEGNAYSVSGTVVNSVTGEPIHRAAVEIFGANRATLTDSSGHFEFGGLEKGRVFVSVTKPGFLNREIPANGGISVEVTPDTTPLLLRMEPAGIIVGRVTTRDEQPLEGFPVQVITKQNVSGRKIWLDRAFQAQTDENGAFRIANLPSSTYYLVVDPGPATTLGQSGVPNARELGYAKLFYPGVSEFSAAAPLELHAGQQLETSFTLTGEPLYDVSGAAIAREGNPSQLTFQRRAGESYDFTQMAVTQDGKFQAKLPGGSYSVSGPTAGGVQLSTSGASVVVSSDTKDVHIVLAPAARIPVEVRRESSGGAQEQKPSEGDGAPGATRVTLQLVSTAPFLRPSYWWRSGVDGIQNVEPGVYTLEIFTPGQWWVKSLQCGGVDLLDDDLTIAAGIQPSPIEITLRDDGASVIGAVMQPERLETATILLVQPHGHRNLIKVAAVVQSKFQFSGVPPGEYSLLAIDHTDQLEYADPEVLSPYLSDAVHITLQAHATASVNLSLSHLGK
jgi:hypothetical protein